MLSLYIYIYIKKYHKPSLLTYLYKNLNDNKNRKALYILAHYNYFHNNKKGCNQLKYKILRLNSTSYRSECTYFLHSMINALKCRLFITVECSSRTM